MANVTTELSVANDYYIELSVRNDYSSGREYFKKNLHTLTESSRSEIGLYQYIHWGSFDKIELEDLCAIDRGKTLKKHLLDYALNIDWNFWTKAELRKMTKDGLVYLIETHIIETDLGLDKWLEFAEETNITIGANSFKFYKTRGHSQGDFAEWCIRISDLEELEDMNIKLPPYINNLFWGAPISYSLTVDGEDYCIVEHVNDAYEYNKDEVYGICKELFKNHKEKEYILGYIKGNLPEYPNDWLPHTDTKTWEDYDYVELKNTKNQKDKI